MVRLRFKVEVAVSSTTAEDRDLGNISAELVCDSQGEGGSWKTKVVAGASDVQIQLPNVASATFLFLKTTAVSANDTPVSLTFKRETVGGEAFVVAPLSSTREGFWLATSGLTALYCSNAGAVDMEVIVFTAGD